MNKFLKGMFIGMISLYALSVNAKCFWEDVVVRYNQDCEVQTITKGGKEPNATDRARILDRVEQKLASNGGECGDGGTISGAEVEGSGAVGAEVEKVRQEIVKMMLVTSDVGSDTQAKKYINNINSVRENHNKMKLNAVTRSIALGKRAVALALKSGEDIDALREEIETSNDMIYLLKGIAKLQAQHLQKTNQITALRSKLLELNSIDAIIAGDIHYYGENTADTGNDLDGN